MIRQMKSQKMTVLLIIALFLPHSTMAGSDTHAKAAATVSAAKSLEWLKHGNTRFHKKHFRNDGESAADVERLSHGQSPHAIVVSCSDSRVPPEIVFDQKLGEIFTVRNAGMTLDNNAIGSIEYALEHLGSKLIVVMGHTKCGAVKAAMDTMGGKDAGSPALNALVKDIQPRLQSTAGKPVSTDLADESWANIDGVAQDLMRRSTIVRKRVESGDIQIQGALYQLNSGLVDFNKSPSLRVPASQKTASH